MIDKYTSLLNFLVVAKQTNWEAKLRTDIAEGLSFQRFGDLSEWTDALNQLPDIVTENINLKDGVTIGTAEDLSTAQQHKLKQLFERLIPWRKGPYALFDIEIETEWRSDWKWDRIVEHIKPLANRRILDVGCGNGYHCLRMFGAGAERIIGIDPSPRFVIQFLMLKHFLDDIPVDVLPIGIEALPNNLRFFDTTFSMGVFYHRRSPMDHLKELKATLNPGGQLVLETLIIDGKIGECLVPEGRYAMMRNVWFLPSAPTLLSWLKKAGFSNPRLIDTSITTIEEQRATAWMRFQSLVDFLDPNDHSKTVEGYSAPLRATFVADAL
jgi:tRNA (mo5U34)-methyltransferase